MDTGLAVAQRPGGASRGPAPFGGPIILAPKLDRASVKETAATGLKVVFFEDEEPGATWRFEDDTGEPRVCDFLTRPFPFHPVIGAASFSSAGAAAVDALRERWRQCGAAFSHVEHANFAELPDALAPWALSALAKHADRLAQRNAQLARPRRR